MAPPIRPPAPLDEPYVDLRVTSPDSEAESQPSPPDIDLTESAPGPAPAPAPTPAAPSAHAVELVETGAFAHAACSACGWTGPARRSRSVALADLDRHP